MAHRFDEDDFYDGESDYWSSLGYTEDYADEGAPQAPTAAPAAVTIRDATEEARRAKESAQSEARAAQRAAEEAREARCKEVAEARSWLQERGFASDALADDEALQTASCMKAQADDRAAELEEIAARKSISGCSVNVSDSRVPKDASVRLEVEEWQMYVKITMGAAYPGDVRSVTVDSDLRSLSAFMTHAVRTSKLSPERGCLTRLVEFAASAMGCEDFDEPADGGAGAAAASTDAADGDAADTEDKFASLVRRWRAEFGETLPAPAHGISVLVDAVDRPWHHHQQPHGFRGPRRDQDYAVVRPAQLAYDMAVRMYDSCRKRHEALLAKPPSTDTLEQARTARLLAALEAELVPAKKRVERTTAMLAQRKEEKATVERELKEAAERQAKLDAERRARATELLAKEREAVVAWELQQRQLADAIPDVDQRTRHVRNLRKLEKRMSKTTRESLDRSAYHTPENTREKMLVKLAVALEEEHEFFTFSYPKLLNVPDLISKVTTLTHLDLSGCGLTSLPNLGDMRLRKLYLSKNNFERFPASVMTAACQDLRVLDVSRNKLRDLPRGLSELRSLEQLIVEYNDIDELCDVSQMNRLEVVEATDNQLRSLPASLSSRERLWRLKVGANPLIDVPPEVYHQGLKALVKYLSEMSPGNLPVPPSVMRHDLTRASAGEALGLFDCEVTAPLPDCSQSQGGDTARPGPARFTALAALVEARAPGALRFADPPAASADQATLVRRVRLPEPTSHAAMRVFGLLLIGSATTDDISDLSDVDQVRVTELVSTCGSESLNLQLQVTARGQLFDADRVLSRELATLTRTCPSSADTKLPFGRVMRFAVGAEGVHFVVDRSVLCARAEYFRSMMASGLAEASMDVIPLPDIEPHVFEAFLQYIYMDEPKKMSPENVIALLFVAAQFDIPRLRAMAECMVGFYVDVTNVAQVLQVAHFVDSDRLKRACLFFAARNQSAVRITDAFGELDPEIRAEFHAKVLELQAAGIES